MCDENAFPSVKEKKEKIYKKNRNLSTENVTLNKIRKLKI